jgi:hypothetical protein
LKSQCSSLYHASGLFSRALGPLHTRCVELIQQKLLLSRQLAFMSTAYDEVSQLAAAISGSWSASKLTKAGKPPVSLRGAVIAVMAGNRLAWFQKTQVKSLGEPHAIHTCTSTSGFAGLSSRKSATYSASWRRSYHEYVFLAPQSAVSKQSSQLASMASESRTDDTDVAARLLTALSCFLPALAVHVSNAASAPPTIQWLFRGLRSQFKKTDGSCVDWGLLLASAADWVAGLLQMLRCPLLRLCVEHSLTYLHDVKQRRLGWRRFLQALSSSRLQSRTSRRCNVWWLTWNSALSLCRSGVISHVGRMQWETVSCACSSQEQQVVSVSQDRLEAVKDAVVWYHHCMFFNVRAALGPVLYSLAPKPRTFP